VIDGCVRDGALLGAIGFPVFARGLSIRGTGKDFDALGSLNEVLLIGDVSISPGDLMIGDQDGLVCIPRTRVPEVLQASLAREKSEETILARLRAGENTMKIYNLDR
jgi:4-hydroxy-4-methyl-2-oxoglutarate aldolase